VEGGVPETASNGGSAAQVRMRRQLRDGGGAKLCDGGGAAEEEAAIEEDVAHVRMRRGGAIRLRWRRHCDGGRAAALGFRSQRR